MRQKSVIWRFVPPARAAACAAVAALGWLAVAEFPSVSLGLSTSRPVWSRPVVVDRVAPTQGANPVEATCPFQNLCLAVDGLGNVLSTSDPVGDGPWGITRVPTSTNVLTLPACASVHLCILGDHNGHLFVSTAPAAGRGVWRRTGFSDSLPIQEIVCPSTSLCVLADTGGHLFTSTDPTGGMTSWHRLRLHVQDIEGISCPTTQFCALTTLEGQFFSSSDPAGGPSAWSGQSLISGASDYLNGIACPSAQLCVTFDANDNVLSSTTPGTGPWHKRSGIRTGGIGSIWCRSTSLCFIGDIYGGHLLVSSDPAEAWHQTTFPSAQNGQVEVACPSMSFCLATDSTDTRGYLFSATDPENGPWQAMQPIDGYNHLTGVACAAGGMCAAIDGAGDVLTSTDPSGGPSVWQGERIAPGHSLESVSCATTRLCVAVDDGGGVHSSSDPTTGNATWRGVEIDRRASLRGVACPSRHLCLAVDDAGRVLTTTQPTGGKSAWHRAMVGHRSSLVAVACPSASRCLAAGDGDVFTSTDPAGGPARWRRVRLKGAPAISSIACPSRGLCILTASTGGLVVSLHPWARRPRWHREMATDADSHLREVACASAQLCIGIYRLSHEGETVSAIYASTDPAASAPKWSYSSSTLGNPTGLACQPQTTTCMAVDDAGEVLASR